MKKYNLIINGNEYNVGIVQVEGNQVTVEVNGTTYDVQMDKKETKAKKTPTLVRSSGIPASSTKTPEVRAKAAAGGNKVTAPLPGTILHIHVKVGDTIKKGQNLLTMEAMKMENSILAEKDGVVSAIVVKEGQVVLQGDTLFEI